MLSACFAARFLSLSPLYLSPSLFAYSPDYTLDFANIMNLMHETVFLAFRNISLLHHSHCHRIYGTYISIFFPSLFSCILFNVFIIFVKIFSQTRQGIAPAPSQPFVYPTFYLVNRALLFAPQAFNLAGGQRNLYLFQIVCSPFSPHPHLAPLSRLPSFW